MRDRGQKTETVSWWLGGGDTVRSRVVNMIYLTTSCRLTNTLVVCMGGYDLRFSFQEIHSILLIPNLTQ